MIKKTAPIIREFVDIPDHELKNALIDFCNRLHIHGSGEGYNLYDVVLIEKAKAKKQRDLQKSTGQTTF